MTYFVSAVGGGCQGAGLSLVGFVMEINLRAKPQFSSKINEGKREELTRRVGRLLGLKMLNDAMNNLRIILLEGPDSLIDSAAP
jgi:hypothetical protein